MATENYNIYKDETYVTTTQDGGTIFFEPLYSDDNVNAAGQVWEIDDSFNNVTITCYFNDDVPPLYLTANSAEEGDYVGSTIDQTENSFWSIDDEGSLQLINDGNATGVYAVMSAETGLLTLASSPVTKWKFSKTLKSIKGWEK